MTQLEFFRNWWGDAPEIVANLAVIALISCHLDAEMGRH